MTDIIEKAAIVADEMICKASPIYGWNSYEIARAVIRSLRDNTDSPRVCDELTRMLGEGE